MTHTRRPRGRSRTRAFRSLVLSISLVLGGVFAVLGPAGTASAATVCRDTTGIVQSSPIYLDNNPKKARLATLWYHSTTHGGCTVLRAEKWAGTSHVIGIQVCGGVRGNTPGYGSGCSAWDRASYKYYAGPVYWNALCARVHVYIKNPSSKVVYDHAGFVFACD